MQLTGGALRAAGDRRLIRSPFFQTLTGGRCPLSATSGSGHSLIYKPLKADPSKAEVGQACSDRRSQPRENKRPPTGAKLSDFDALLQIRVFQHQPQATGTCRRPAVRRNRSLLPAPVSAIARAPSSASAASNAAPRSASSCSVIALYCSGLFKVRIATDPRRYDQTIDIFAPSTFLN
jgi:hypothetical protein